MTKYIMAKEGTANINNHGFDWKIGDSISLSDNEARVLKRGGYVLRKDVVRKKKTTKKAK